MSVMSSQITRFNYLINSLIGLATTKYQRFESLVLLMESTGDQWIPLTKGRQCRKLFHAMTYHVLFHRDVGLPRRKKKKRWRGWAHKTKRNKDDNKGLNMKGGLDFLTPRKDRPGENCTKPKDTITANKGQSNLTQKDSVTLRKSVSHENVVSPRHASLTSRHGNKEICARIKQSLDAREIADQGTGR